MDIVWIVLKIIIANILLFIVSSTLVGFIIRGMLQPRTANPYTAYTADWYTMSKNRGLIISIITFGFSVLLFILLFNYSNIYIVIGILLNMLTRIKDLIKEIRTGIKTTNKSMSVDKIDIVLTIISWLGIGIFNYGLYLIWIR